MPQIAVATPQARNCYELVGRRIQRLIATPNVQKVQAVTVSRRKDESVEAGQQVLQEIEETSGVRIDRLESGAVRIGWREYYEV
ncbi:hypothetical protein HK44_007975 [Pseudomonas fluorescens HK44]|uniref:Uncharacterized protein n=1 Tax=Pseudomonas fluorescens HK44 TaxID=1042209 RepID=A0A010RXI9_PSEFL|nr:DUF1654 domain-containing protein [Pseudomonas fluorescens]EXF93594.1 hypothetical protein HK44_007975 [Pseudomonas fluorescens HK44]